MVCSSHYARKWFSRYPDPLLLSRTHHTFSNSAYLHNAWGLTLYSSPFCVLLETHYIAQVAPLWDLFLSEGVKISMLSIL